MNSPEPQRRAAAFVDRDGVINEERRHVGRIADFQLLPGAINGLGRLASLGYALVVVTNQAGIAKGLYTQGDYDLLTDHMRSLLAGQGITLAGVYHCPHHPQASVPSLRLDCDCRKPRPGLLLRAAAELGLDLRGSVLVGDKRSDLEAGRAAGVGRRVLVRSGHPIAAQDEAAADHVAADLAAAAAWIAAVDMPRGGRQARPGGGDLGQ
jgi:D-glycero-D-manno-heptose 1,7-bisphosphate phosphatase